MKSCYRKTFILNGYLTVFLSLMLTLLLSVILGLVGGATQNLEKLRFECAADIAMNSVLGEFHRELLEQYDLFFVDISYHTGHGLIANVEEHVSQYMNKNLHATDKGIALWNELAIKQVDITEYVLATDYEGVVMQQQAIAYMKESQLEDSFTDLRKLAADAKELDKVNGMEMWNDVMGQIAGISMPLTSDGNGGWEEVSLDNPADEVFNMAQDQLYNLSYAAERAGSGVIDSGSYLSKRGLNAGKSLALTKEKESENYLFYAYLFNKFGTYRQKKPKSILDYQIEYIVFGENSDRKNIAAATERIFRWRFADYIQIYLYNDLKISEAMEIAGSLPAVQLKQELLEPVSRSILYAWAFLDSLHDTDIILRGGKIPLFKESFDYTGAGQDYRQYLWLMLALEGAELVSLRVMDIIEMDIRQTDYNQEFRMDWCLESYCIQVVAEDRTGAFYEISRKYGYYESELLE